MLCVEPERRPGTQQRPRRLDSSGSAAWSSIRRLASGAIRLESRTVEVLVVFDGPARAIRCGCAIGAEARRFGIGVRLGLHTGECDMIAGMCRTASSSTSAAA